MNNKKIFSIILALILISSFNLTPALAYTIEDNPIVKNSGDFAVGAGKIEVSMDPGTTATREVEVTNRMGRDASFGVSVEDFGPSSTPGEVTQLYANNDGPYSLRKYLKPELTQFTLKQGQVMHLPIEIKIPATAPAGGLYGSVIISNAPDLQNKDSNNISGSLGIESRIGILFFVKVNGDVAESGGLIGFNSEKTFYSGSQINLPYVYHNDGGIYVNPYGTILIRDMFGREILKREIQPYFVLPKTSRTMAFGWTGGFMLGKYTATITLNRGYDNIVDTKVVTFWVVPWPVILVSIIFVLLIVLAFFLEKKKAKKYSKKLENKKEKIKKK